MEFLEYQYIQNAIFSGLLASFICGIVGVFVVIKRIVFLSGGISHASFGGIGFAYYLGIEPFIGATIFAVLTSVGLGYIDESKIDRSDAYIGILWAVGMSMGILFVHLVPGFAPNLITYLFGDILIVSQTDIILLSILLIIILIVFYFLFQEFVAISFDIEYIKTKNIPVRIINIILYIFIALTIVLLIEIVGIILVIALLTIPPSISLIYTRSIFKMIISSVIISFLMIMVGLLLTIHFDIPSGASIVLPGGIILIMLRLRTLMFHKKKKTSLTNFKN